MSRKPRQHRTASANDEGRNGCFGRFMNPAVSAHATRSRTKFAENAGVGWMAVPWCLPDLASLKGGDPVVQAFRKFAVDAKRRFTQRIILYRE